MENRKALLGMFVMLLTFTLVLAACGSSPFALFGIGTTGAGKNAAADEFIETEEWVMVRIDEGKLGIIKYKGRSETVLVPAEFEGVPVVVFGDVFSGNTTLKSVSIPEGFTSISKDAFDGCTGLTSIAIPASVVSIGGDVDKAEDAFDGCTGLTDITVAEANEVYSAEDGVLFNKDKTTLFLCPEGKSGSYTIPPSVTGIAYCAFEICVKLTDVTIPDSVTSIGDAAFYKCAGLTSIIIPSRVMSIGAAAFFECTGLTSATISEGVTSIGERAFQDCTGLTSITIPASIKTITGDTRNEGVYGAFNGCTGLTSVTISEGVASIGATAFFGCTGLPSITIPDSVTYIGGNAFALCTSLTSVTISPVPGREWDFRGKKAGSVYWIFDSSPKLSSASKTALRNAGYQGQELSR